MNRRELFKKIAASATVAGIATPTVTAIAADPKPALLLLETDRFVVREAAEEMLQGLADALVGTPFEGLKGLYITGGVKVSFLDASGHVLNRELTDPIQA